MRTNAKRTNAKPKQTNANQCQTGGKVDRKRAETFSWCTSLPQTHNCSFQSHDLRIAQRSRKRKHQLTSAGLVNPQAKGGWAGNARRLQYCPTRATKLRMQTSARRCINVYTSTRTLAPTQKLQRPRRPSQRKTKLARTRQTWAWTAKPSQHHPLRQAGRNSCCPTLWSIAYVGVSSSPRLHRTTTGFPARGATRPCQLHLFGPASK